MKKIGMIPKTSDEQKKTWRKHLERVDKDTVVLNDTRLCDFCIGQKRTAQYDGKTKIGPWAYMCEEHFQIYGIGLGPGRGQRLLYRKKGE